LDQVLDHRLCNVTQEMKARCRNAKNVLRAHDVDGLVSADHVLIHVHPETLEDLGMVGEVPWLAVVFRRPPKSDRALRPRQMAIGDELRDRAADLEQTGTAAGVVVHRLLTL